MCESNNCCQKPELLKDVPGKCTPGQIRICHGDGKGHPCTDSDQESEKSKD